MFAEYFGVDPLTDFMLQSMVIGAGFGYYLCWSNSVEGKLWWKTRILKKRALELFQFHGSHLYKREVVEPQTHSFRKKLGFLDKLLGKKEQDDHTMLPNWFDSDAPIWREIGSRRQTIFNFKGQAQLFDPASVEYGYYSDNEESNAWALKGAEAAKKADALREQGKALMLKDARDEAAALLPQLQAFDLEAQECFNRRLQCVRWNRVTTLPTTEVSALMDNEETLMKAKVAKSFLGKMEALMKNINFWLIIAAGSGVGGLMLQMYGILSKGGFKFF